MTRIDLLAIRDAAIHVCDRCGNRVCGKAACGLCAILDARAAGAA